MGGVIFGDGDVAGDEQVALVDAGFHHVPADAVVGFAVEQSPDGRVETGHARQGAVVEVDRALGGQGQHVVGDDREVGDAEEPVEARARAQACNGVVDGQPVGRRPADHVGVGRDHGGDAVAVVEQLVAATDQESFFANKRTGKPGHFDSSTRGLVNGVAAT